MSSTTTTPPEPKAALSRRRELASLWQQMRGYRARYAAAIVALFIGTAFALASPQLIRLAIDYLLLDAPVEPATGWRAALLERIEPWGLGGALAALAGLSVAFVTASGGFMFLRGWWANLAAEGICRRLRDRLYDRLQRAAVPWHDAAETGDTVQRCSSDVETIRAFLAAQVIEVVRAVANLTLAVPIIFLMDWRLGLASTVIMPIFIGWGLIAFRWIHATFKVMDESEGALTSRVQENLTNIRVVRAFARQGHETARFDALNQDYTDKYWKHYVVLSWYWAASDMMVFLQLALSLFVGAWLVQLGPGGGGIAVGTLVAAWLYVGMVVWPVRQMGRTLSELGKAMVAIERVDEVLVLPEEARPGEPVDPLPERLTGRIVFDGVTFGHAEDRHALNGLSFAVEPGETLGILGPSGSGKSTLVHLLLRFYDVPADHVGGITIDGLALERLPRAFVRSQVGAVMQEPFLYGKSIRENLRLAGAGGDVDDDALQDVARAAAVHDSIERFDQGYDTMLGERGVTLSGGQRQRVAIARALLQDKPIVVLDDAFSAVDTHTETAILAALRERRQDRAATTLLIAHRLSTLQHADRILVLDHGKVTQQGTHAELIQQDGLYARLWAIQSSAAV